MRINDYEDYIAHICKKVHENGNMSSSTILDFIRTNQLDTRFAIDFCDVVRDVKWVKEHLDFCEVKYPPITIKTGVVGKVKNNKTYTFLIGEWAKKGYQLSDEKIHDLLNSNHLEQKYNLTVADVRMDIQEYKKIHEMPTAMKAVDNEYLTEMMKRFDKERKIDFRAYKTFVEKCVGMSEERRCDGRLEELIEKEGFDKFGITIEQVKSDIKAGGINIPDGKAQAKVCKEVYLADYVSAMKLYISKWRDQAFLDSYIEKFAQKNGFQTRSKSYKDDIRMDILLLNSTKDVSSNLAKTFPIHDISKKNSESDDFQTELSNMIVRHKDLIAKKTTLKGLLWDYFPEKKKEVNVLIKLLEYGILEEMESQSQLDSIFINRYVNRLINDQGIDTYTSRKMTETWCIVYGETILEKNMDFQ